jgi:hypothetical protein
MMKRKQRPKKRRIRRTSPVLPTQWFWPRDRVWGHNSRVGTLEGTVIEAEWRPTWGRWYYRVIWDDGSETHSSERDLTIKEAWKGGAA